MNTNMFERLNNKTDLGEGGEKVFCISRLIMMPNIVFGYLFHSVKFTLVVPLLGVCLVQADDHVTIKFQGSNMSDHSVTITIDRPFDKSGVVVPEVFKRLKAISALKTKSFVVPDAAYITIGAEVDGERLEASSCHTLFEANGKLVAKSTGVAALGGLTREKALCDEPKDFMDFRRLWEEALSISTKAVIEKFNPRARAKR
jgi:hypothetical protein